MSTFADDPAGPCTGNSSLSEVPPKHPIVSSSDRPHPNEKNTEALSQTQLMPVTSIPHSPDEQQIVQDLLVQDGDESYSFMDSSGVMQPSVKSSNESLMSWELCPSRTPKARVVLRDQKKSESGWDVSPTEKVVREHNRLQLYENAKNDPGPVEETVFGSLFGERPVQQAVHYLRSFRPFCVETPMQYVFIHRAVQHFIKPMAGLPQGFEQDYSRWLDERSQRLFVDDFHGAVPAFRLISPRVDPDLLPLVHHRERPEYRREMHAHVGELPLPAERYEGEEEGEATTCSVLANIQLPKRYPRGRRYD